MKKNNVSVGRKENDRKEGKYYTGSLVFSIHGNCLDKIWFKTYRDVYL